MSSMSKASIDLVDPILSSDTAVISTPSPSRARPTDEREPLLLARKKKPFYRARPMWIVPFAMTAALARSMTLAPRVEVFTQLACAQLYKQPFNHSLDHHLSFHLPNNNTIPSFNSTQPPDEDDGDDDADDPRRLPSPRCLTDTSVLAGAARLQTIMTTTMGSLSALTSGYWGHVGQRRGRLFVMALATFGLFLTDLTFILVSTPNTPLSAHGHKLLILAPIIEGTLGGWSALQGATTAYISDCTSPGSRATIFSRFTGVFYTGFSIGPVIGGYIIRSGFGSQPTKAKTVTAVFWTAMFCSLANFFLAMFIFPESLPKEKRAEAMDQHRREHSGKGKGRAVSISPDESNNFDTPNDGVTVYSSITTFAYNIFSPLALFLPTVVTDVNGARREDWSLTFIGLGLFLYFLATGVYQIKYLYATHTFSWNTEQLSYYISGMGFTRAVFLLFILPLLVATFKPKPKASAGNQDPSFDTNKPGKPKLTKTRLAQEIRFDLLVARSSLIVDFMSNALAAFVPVPTYKVHQLALGTGHSSSRVNSEIFFVLATVLSGFGSGIVPAVQSLVLCVMQARAAISGGSNDVNVAEGGTGKLLGALAVLQATGQMIVGPLLFGLIYSGTVAQVPKAIFMTAAGILVIALISMSLVSNPITKRVITGKAKVSRRAVEEETERGRSRVSKDLFGAAGGSNI